MILALNILGKTESINPTIMVRMYKSIVVPQFDNPTNMVRMYKNIVVPQLEYAAPVWQAGKCDVLSPGVSLTLCCFVVYSTRRFVVCLLCVILFLCFSVLSVLRLPRFGKRGLILVLFARLFDLCLFGFVGFLFLLGSGKGFVALPGLFSYLF